MKKRILAVAWVSAAVLTLAAGTAFSAGIMAVDIPFSFVVNDKEIPAGRYEIQPTGNHENRLVLRSAGGGGAFVLTVIERLADTGAKEPQVVFDRVENKNYLSEVHIPGGDGFLVGIAKARETHVVVKGRG
jgi:hypothetical protein